MCQIRPFQTLASPISRVHPETGSKRCTSILAQVIFHNGSVQLFECIFFLSAILYPPKFSTHSFVHKEDGMSREELPPAKKKISERLSSCQRIRMHYLKYINRINRNFRTSGKVKESLVLARRKLPGSSTISESQCFITNLKSNMHWN